MGCGIGKAPGRSSERNLQHSSMLLGFLAGFGVFGWRHTWPKEIVKTPRGGGGEGGLPGRKGWWRAGEGLAYRGQDCCFQAFPYAMALREEVNALTLDEGVKVR